MHCRPESSDLEAFWQVLVGRQFDFLERSSRQIRAIDCGANIGPATLAKDAVKAFEQAVGTQFAITRCGELTVATRPDAALRPGR